MKLKQELNISIEDIDNPKNIRFQDCTQLIDNELIVDVQTRQERFPAGTHDIALNNISEGRFLAVKPINENVQVEINGSNALMFRKGTVSVIWVIYNQLKLITSKESEVLIVIAGE